MKQVICFLLILALAQLVNAQDATIMVCNPAGTTCTPFKQIDLAIAQANAGDHIYLSGGYFKITQPINKELHIHGAGYLQDSASITNKTVIVNNLKFTNASENSTLEGFELIGQIINNQNIDTLRNITFKRILLNPSTSDEVNIRYCLFHECVFDAKEFVATNDGLEKKSTFRNCIVSKGLYHITSTVIANCIFLGGDPNGCLTQSNDVWIEQSILFAPMFNNIASAEAILNSGAWATGVQNILFEGYGNLTYYSYPPYAFTTFSNNQLESIANCSNYFASCPSSNFNLQVGIYHLLSNPLEAYGIYAGPTPWKDGAPPSGNPRWTSNEIKLQSSLNAVLPATIKAKTVTY